MAGRYEFDWENIRFRKVSRSAWRILRGVVAFLVGTVSLTIFYYVVFSLFFSTDEQRSLQRENRMYASLYDDLSRRTDFLETVIGGLELRDDGIYEDIFHTAAPVVDPGGDISLAFPSDSVQESEVVRYTRTKARSLMDAAGRVDDNFMHIFSVLASDGYVAPPMGQPLEGMTYAQTGASTGMKVSPFYKVAVQHNGLDIIAGQGENVYASGPGTVRDVVRYGKGLGNYVEIDHGGGYVTRYTHLADISVSKGQKVARGRKIGTVGVSGNSFAPHLHYEVLRDGKVEDPVNYMFGSLSPDLYAGIAYMSASTGQSMD